MERVRKEIAPEDLQTIEKIVRKAKRVIEKWRGKIDLLKLRADLIKAYSHNERIDLETLYTFDEFNFLHDIIGIMRHLNQKTGKFKDHFVPRAARQKPRQVASDEEDRESEASTPPPATPKHRRLGTRA